MSGAQRSTDAGVIAAAILVGLGALALALLGIAITRHSGNVASLWVANAVLIAALATQGRRRWRPLVAAFAAGNTAANLIVGDTLAVSLCFGAINAGEGVLAALLFARLAPEGPDFERTPNLLAFGLATGVVAPLAAATVGAGFVAVAFGTPYAAVWPTWFAADALGNLTLGPLLILLVRLRDPSVPAAPIPIGRLASSALLVLAACAAVFLQARYPLLFLIVPAASVATHRSGPLGAALAVLLVTGAGGTATLMGRGPMALMDTGMPARILMFQLLLLTLLACTLPLAALLAERRALEQRLRDAAHRDPLTGLFNRAALMADLDVLLARGDGPWQGAALILVDIDHFKAVNDRHGHLVGDRVLEDVALSLSEASRSGDIVGRLGGEEFVVLLPRAGIADAQRVAERLRRTVEVRSATSDWLPHVTISAGAAEATPGETPESLIDRADRALYAAKGAGRNRVELAA